MNDLPLVLICACSTTLIACIFDYFYFSRRYKELEEKTVPNIYILEIDKNIIYVEKGE